MHFKQSFCWRSNLALTPVWNEYGFYRVAARFSKGPETFCYWHGSEQCLHDNWEADDGSRWMLITSKYCGLFAFLDILLLGPARPNWQQKTIAGKTKQNETKTNTSMQIMPYLIFIESLVSGTIAK